MRRFRVSHLFLSLALLVLLAFVALLYSTTVLRFVVYNALPEQLGLKIAQIDGTLADTVHLHGISVDLPALNLRLEQAQIALDLHCLARLAFCVPELAVSNLTVTVPKEDVPDSPLPQGPEASSEEETRPSAFNFPSVNIGKLTLTQGQFNYGDLEISLDSLETGGKLSGSQIRLMPSRLGRLTLELPPTDTAAKKEGPWWEYQVPVLEDFPLPFTLELETTTLEHLHITGGFELELLDILLKADVTPKVVVLHQAKASYQEYAIDAKAQFRNELPFKLDALANVVSPSQELTTRLSGTLENLLIEAHASGVQSAKLQAEVGVLQEKLPLKGTLNADHLQWPLLGKAEYLLSQSQLSFAGSLNKLAFEFATAAEAEQLTAQPLRATLTTKAEFDAPSLRWSSLEVNSELGQLKSQGEFALDTFTLKTNLEADKVNLGVWLADYPSLVQAKIALEGRYQADNWSLFLQNLQASGTVKDQPLWLSGSLDAKGKGLSISHLQSPSLELRHGSNSLVAKGSLNQVWQAQVTLNVPDLSKSLAQSAGSLQGQIEVTGQERTPKLTMNVTADKLRYLTDFRVDAFQLQGDLDTKEFAHQLTLSAKRALISGRPITEATLTLQGNQNASRAKLDATGRDFSTSLALEATSSKLSRWQVQLNEAFLQTQLGQWTLEETSTLQFDIQKQNAKLSRLCLRSDFSFFCVKETSWLSAQKGSVALAIEKFDLDPLAVFFADTQKLTGTVTGSADINWQTKRPLNVSAQLQSSHGSWQQTEVNPLIVSWQQANASLTIKDNQLKSRLNIVLSDTGELSADFGIPNLTEKDKPLEGNLQLARIKLQPLRSLLPDESEFDGTLSGQLRLSGRSNQPQIQGQLHVDAIRMFGANAPFDIEQGSILLNFQQHGANLSGTLKSGQGQLTLSGYADWYKLEDFQARFGLSGQAFPVTLPQGTLVVSPQLSLSARNLDLSVEGSVSVPQARIAIDDFPPNAVKVSRDEIILNRDLEIRRTAEQSALKLHTNVKILLGQQVHLQAFGLKSRLEGQLTFTQNSAQQTLHGEVNLREGNFRAYGQDLQIRSGQLIFNGPIEQPYLSVEAIRNPERTEDNVIAGVRVTGPVNQASVLIFSQPSKPQANALAYLLTGRDLNSENSANPLTTALIGIGLSSSSGLFTSVGEAFGLQDVTVDTAGIGDSSQVTISGYLSPRLQLRYGVGIFTSLGEFTLRYELMKNLYLEAVRGLDTAVDVLYKFEFD